MLNLIEVLQETVLHKVEVTDFMTDSFAGEGVTLLVLERIWSRVQGYLRDRDKKVDESELDKRMDAIDRKLSKIDGKQDTFEKMLNNNNLKL